MEKLTSLDHDIHMDIEKIIHETEQPKRDPKTIKPNEKTVVCSHWLRGSCKLGNNCGYLHEYDLDKTPMCNHFEKYGKCDKPECPFRHEAPSNSPKCEWYIRGFCSRGKKCHNLHPKKLLCPLYFMGFCPYGKQCKYSHPSPAPMRDNDRPKMPNKEQQQQ
ncbi:mRNA 3'-end-processing protein YTH1, putative [Entamoeba invadens IP1]|uniref:mRNA 3'-end-processing protein YTH1, putative n=1 Tax=Entamoeba invadens IP1 TaxID=370355 RepID=UPI0002C3DB67|nr:mRNA 3'-end-processing protein YTH1, putative [Entamoeba invadens IP1]ELP93099.1 mRNA 3'-end-processing protein YTH1, putative [Entamoeba invadens IP1]|eukprot:XP_004259870.1 mRNA 3'-end-processing protein YTH1, putative [Entamoeba invadens IP1]